MTTPNDFVRNWWDSNSVRMEKLGRLIVNNKNLTKNDALNALIGSYTEHFYSHQNSQRNRPLKFSEAELERSLETKLKAEIARALDQTNDDIKFDHVSTSFVKVFLNDLLGRQPDSLELACTMHWMWTVKRKMRNLPTSRELFLNVFGPQGSGKSTAIKKLLSVIEPFVWHSTVTSITDSRESFNFEQNYIVFLDELQGAERSDREAIKRLVTSSEIHVRPMRTNSVSNVILNARPIGCSNRPLREMLSDRTGMRRFFELELTTKSNWNRINQLNFTEVWKAVDELREHGYLDTEALLKELTERQKQYVYNDPLESWSEQLDWNETLQPRRIQDVTTTINNWLKDNGYRQTYNENNIGTFLKNKTGQISIRKSIGGVRIRFVYVPGKTCPLPPNYSIHAENTQTRQPEATEEQEQKPTKTKRSKARKVKSYKECKKVMLKRNVPDLPAKTKARLQFGPDFEVQEKEFEPF